MKRGLLAGIARVNAPPRSCLTGSTQPRVHGAFYERLARAALLRTSMRWIETAAWPAGTVTGRVLLAGSVPPDDRLHLAVERRAWSSLARCMSWRSTRLGPLTVDIAHAADAMARQLRRDGAWTTRVSAIAAAGSSQTHDARAPGPWCSG